jgi:hypothetical protein
VNPLVEKYYLSAIEAAPLAQAIGGNATYIPAEDLAPLPSASRFAHCVASLIDAKRSDLLQTCNISFAVFYGDIRACRARKLSDSRYVIFASDSALLDISHFACYLLSIKEIRDALGLDGAYLTSLNGDFAQIDALDDNDISRYLSDALPIWWSAMLFVASHEFRHITNGHLDLAELCPDELFAPDRINLTVKSMESDADCCALNLLMQGMPSIFKRCGRMDDLSNRYVMFDYLNLVLCTVFNRYNLNDLFDKKISFRDAQHPEDFSRFNYMLAMYHTYKAKQGEYIDHRLHNTIFSLVQSVFAKRSGGKRIVSSWDEFYEYWGPHAAFAKDLEMRWNEMRPALHRLKQRISDIPPENTSYG